MSRHGESSNRKLPKFLTKEKVENILDKAENQDYEHYLMLLTLWRGGLRVSELVSLTVREIGFQNDRIEIREGKGDKDRVVPLHGELKTELRRYIDIKDLEDDDLFFDYSTRWIEMMVKKYTDKEWVTPHTFRHSFSVHILNSGLDSRRLQKILGHSSLATTEIYLDLSPKQVIDDFLEKVE